MRIYLFRLFGVKEESRLLTTLNEAVSIIDTEALGQPRVVAAYLISGKEKALIDMGYQSSAEIVIRDLTHQGIGPDGLDYLLPTHVHLDHSGCCGALAKRFTNACVRAHPKGEPHLADPTRLWKGAGELFGDELMQKYGAPVPVEWKRLQVVGDDEEIDLGRGVTLRALWTPGHASHHLSYHYEGTGIIFTGDAVGINYPDFAVLVPTTPPTSFNLDQAVQSLERIRAASPSEFLTPHYCVMKNARQLIDENVNALQHWKTRIEKMTKEGSSVDKLVEALTEETCRRAGRPVTEVPDYLGISIKVSVLGFLRYLRHAASGVAVI